LRAHVHHHAFPWSWSGEVNRKLCASEVDPGGFGPRERDGLAVVEGKDEHGAGEHVPDPIQQPGSGRSIEALGRFVEQEDVGPSEKSLRYAEAPALAAGEGYAARANWRFEPERERRHDIEGRRQCSPQVDVAGMGIGEKEVVPDGP